MVAAVFAATDLGRVLGIDQRGVEVCLFWSLMRRSGDGGRDFVAVDHRLRERQLDLGGLRGVLNGA